eukprot:COSAG02_NODE_14348_length_1281_cov_28.872250_1_plen_88_part_00
MAAAEDLVNSEQLIGEDLSDLLPYYEMAYQQEHGSWFWLAQYHGLERGMGMEEEGEAVVQTPGAIEEMRVVHDLAARASEGLRQWQC